MDYLLIENLNELTDTAAPDSIVSRTVHDDETVKAILFGFAAGQSLSEHTASMGAIIHILEGEATLTLGDDVKAAGAGTWVHMAPRLAHSVDAKTPLKMLLLLLKSQTE